MEPPLRQNQPPPFTDLTAYPFEDLCRELLANQTGVSTCTLYGNRGQAQRMIDLLATRADGKKEVAQCKCYREFDEDVLKTAAEGFLGLLNEWSGWDIVKFIMMVSSSVKNTRIQDEAETQRRAFRAHGIEFEIWGDETIAQKLRPLPSVVAAHMNPLMVLHICPAASMEGMSELLRRSEGLPYREWLLTAASNSTDDFDARVTEIRNLARRGRPREALAQLIDWMKPDRAILVAEATRAKALRTAAGLALDALDDVGKANEFLAEAKSLASQPEKNYEVLDTAITLRTAGIDDALRQLNHPHSTHAMNFRLSLLLQAGQSAQVLAAMAELPFPADGETYCLASIAAHLSGDYVRAGEWGSEALNLAPTVFMVRLHAAKLDCLASVVISAPYYRHLRWPQPFPRQYLRRDDACQLRLVNAERVFAELLGIMEAADDERPFVECWRLACLSMMAGRHRDAESYVLELMGRHTPHYSAAIWALDCGYVVPRERLEKAFALPDNNTPGGVEVGLCCIQIEGGNYDEAARKLDGLRAKFEADGGRFAWKVLRAKLAAHACDEAAITVLLEGETLASRAELEVAAAKVRAEQSGKHGPLAQVAIAAFEAGHGAKFLYDACNAWLQNGMAVQARAWTSTLLTEFPTPAGVALAAQIEYEAGHHTECLALLEKYAPVFPKAELTPHLEVLRVDCLRATGHLGQALSAADQLVAKTPSLNPLLVMFRSQIGIGDVRAASGSGQKLLRLSETPTEVLLEVAQTVVAEDSELAKRCLAAARNRGLSDSRQQLAAWNLGHELGVDGEIDPTLLQTLAENGSGLVQAVTTDEVLAMFRERSDSSQEKWRWYARGDVALHVVFPYLWTPLADMFTEQGISARSSGFPADHPPLLVRSGARTEVRPFPVVEGTLFMDVTALYVASLVGLLDRVEQAFQPILISANLPTLLLEESNQLSRNGRQSEAALRQMQLRDRITYGIQSGTYRTIGRSGPDAYILGDSRELSAIERCLMDTFAAQEHGATHVWFDDRQLLEMQTVQASAAAAPLPVVGISEVIASMRRKGLLSESEDLELRHSLRRCNARYLPIHCDELLALLLEAESGVNGLVETERLTVLRRYVAACQSDKTRVRVPRMEANGSIFEGEKNWIIHASRATSQAITKLWTIQTMPETHRWALADWLMENIFTDVSGLIESLGGRLPDGTEPAISEASVVLLLSDGIGLKHWPLPPQGKRSIRAKYFKWLNTRIFEPLIRSSPETVSRVIASFVEKLMQGFGLRRKRGNKRADIEAAWVRLLISELPESLQNKLNLPEPVLKTLRMTEGKRWVVTLAGCQFERRQFWKALAIARSQGLAEVISFDTKEKFKLGTCGRKKFGLSGPRIQDELVVNLADQDVILQTGHDLKLALKKRRHWFDVSLAERERMINGVAKLKDAGARFIRLHESRESSAEEYYREVSTVMFRSGSLNPIPPDARSLCRNLRITEEESSVTPNLESCALRIMESDGLADAIERLSGVPVLLPTCIIQAVAKLSGQAFQALKSRLDRLLKSPVSRLALLQVIASRSGTDASLILALTHVRAEMLGEIMTGRWSAFHAILAWTMHEFSGRAEYGKLGSGTLLCLVWSHASRLHNGILRTRGTDFEHLQRHFEEMAARHPAAPGRLEVFRSDAAYPLRVSRLGLLLRGMGAIAEVCEAMRALPPLPAPWSVGEESSAGALPVKLLELSALHPNALASYLGRNISDTLRKVVESEAAETLLPDGDLLAASIERLKANSQDWDWWAGVGVSLNDALCPGELDSDLDAALGTAAPSLPADRESLLDFFATRAPFASTGVRQSIEEAFFRIAAVWATEQDAATPGRRVSMAMHILGTLAIVPSEPEETDRRFFALISKLASFWPEVRRLIHREIAWASVVTAGYWPVIVQLRSSM